MFPQLSGDLLMSAASFAPATGAGTLDLDPISRDLLQRAAGDAPDALPPTDTPWNFISLDAEAAPDAKPEEDHDPELERYLVEEIARASRRRPLMKRLERVESAYAELPGNLPAAAAAPPMPPPLPSLDAAPATGVARGHRAHRSVDGGIRREHGRGAAASGRVAARRPSSSADRHGDARLSPGSRRLPSVRRLSLRPCRRCSPNSPQGRNPLSRLSAWRAVSRPLASSCVAVHATCVPASSDVRERSSTATVSPAFAAIGSSNGK